MKRKVLFYLFIFGITIFPIVVVYFSALKLGFLDIDNIEITGTKRASQREILKRSGLIVGESNILFFEDEIREEILKNAWIIKVDIRREFPGRLFIDVEEAEPFCLFRGEDGDLYYMTESGKKLGVANFEEGLDFPVLIGEGIWKPDLLGDALTTLKFSRVSSALNWVEISEINLDSIYGLTLFTNDGRRIDFGVNHIEQKWAKMEKIIRHARSMNLVEKYINMTRTRVGVVNFKI